VREPRHVKRGRQPTPPKTKLRSTPTQKTAVPAVLPGPGDYAKRLHQAGIAIPPEAWVGLVLTASFFAAVVLIRFAGLLEGIVLGPFLAVYFLSTYLTVRAEKRRAKVLPHLPTFVDVLSASLQNGGTIEHSVKHAAQTLPDGVLKKEFNKVEQMLSQHLPLSEALSHVSNAIYGQEIILLVTSIRLFGDSLKVTLAPFERLAVRLREQQAVLDHTERMLLFPKLMFVLLLGLCLAAPAVLALLKPHYLYSAFSDIRVKYIMQGAVAVQVICLLLLKKMAIFHR
jgi:Flp pilus assembly protein TadB